MRVLIQHHSQYRYPRPALLGPQTIRLRPADHARARIESYALHVAPEHRIHWQRDPHGNHVARVTFKSGQEIDALELTVELAVDIRPVNPFDFFVDDRAKTLPFEYPDELDAELAPFLERGDPAYRFGRKVTAMLGELPPNGDTIGLLVAATALVNSKVAYVIRDEAGVYTPEETLEHARGSCRDVAVLLIALLRARGIAARFASGYLVQLTDEGMIPDEPRGVDRDVVDLHAWCEAFVPGAGWIGLDATSGLFTGEGHIPLACVASPAHAAPLEGTSDIGAASVSFSTSIGRLGHEARPTAPYTEETWAQLARAGEVVDARIAAAGLEVWIGGEPTFLARDDQAADEWQGGAIGPDKWKRGQRLASLLREQLAPGGIVLHRTGKHYPGESKPRWALDVVGRRDGRAMWTQRALSFGASGRTPASSTAEGQCGWIDAKVFAEVLCRELSIAPMLHAAYEDPWEVLRAEAALPPVIDPRVAGLDDPEERKRLAAIMNQGVGRVIGYAVPLAPGWSTERWTFRREHLFLLPGDSPMGLRLPLGSLPASPPVAWSEGLDVEDPRQPKLTRPGVAASHAIRTALCIEPRDGQLWVFLPPMPAFADFSALVEAIDRARAASGIDVSLEGYPPPPSPELLRFAVTPDPGVLEVNLPPVASCAAASELHRQVFAAALAAGLTSERYLLDGRMAGSGGGNHITIGGPKPERSPWLVRPDALASLLAFVQHHPSLSYMFSGLFVGPTSQAPRVDEARHDALYELELALPRLHEHPPAWQVDALLRHLLVDVAGSTHRAEISIDKLCDPLTPFGRQGIVEFRAFEMPPHPRMLAAQATLVRALLASFLAEPYTHGLVRWGAELHDKFLLPFWMWKDFEDVLAHLAARGVALPAEAFKPFVELRCPLVGTIDAAGGTVEVRNAIEPWHVLGEEATAGGTSRYVDSSMERLELRAQGLDPERFAVCVNGVALPMRAAIGRDTRVGGVRFRAWCPPHALHPHLGIHHPIRIDVVDTWAKRGVASGGYHVWHPEGRAFDAPPLTRVEAAARRAQRFVVQGPAPWPVATVVGAAHPDEPYTFDLRRVDAGAPMPKAEDWLCLERSEASDR